MTNAFKFILLTSAIVMVSGAAYAAIGPAVPGSVDSTLNSTSAEVDYMVAAFYCEVRGVISGSLGTLAGLIISMSGLYSYLMTKSKYGLFFFIAGVAFTGLPGLFDWYYKGTVTAFGDSDIHNRKQYAAAGLDDIETLEHWCEGVTLTTVNNEAAPVSEVKDTDADALQGAGLKSISNDDNDYYEYKVINEDGTTNTTLSGQFKFK